jgi:hypothetical protein
LPEGAEVTSGAVTINGETYYTSPVTVTYSGNEYLKVGNQSFVKGSNGTFILELTADAEISPATFIETLEQKDGAYLIKTAEDLQNLAEYVNAGNDCSGKTFKIADDVEDKIDLSGIEWTPIGNDDSKQFKGTFDGNGKTIDHLTITGNNNYVGLFGKIYGGEVKNVNLTNVNISGNYDVGGVVGFNYNGTVSGCTVSGDSSVSGNSAVGGVVGVNNGTVSGSTNFGSVTGKGNVGGVVGCN